MTYPVSMVVGTGIFYKIFSSSPSLFQNTMKVVDYSDDLAPRIITELG